LIELAVSRIQRRTVVDIINDFLVQQKETDDFEPPKDNIVQFVMNEES
jgi:hypothetical protein